MPHIARDLPSTGRLETTQVGEEDLKESTEPTRAIFMIKVLFGFVFYILVLVCTVFSKLTLVKLTDNLREATFCNDSSTAKECKSKDGLAVSLYWQLLLVMIIPTFIEFLRSLVFGVLGKTTKTYPWPRMKSIIVVSHIHAWLMHVHPMQCAHDECMLLA